MGETQFMQRGVWEIMMVAAEAMHSVLAVRRKGGETDRSACTCTVEDPAVQSNEDSSQSNHNDSSQQCATKAPQYEGGLIVSRAKPSFKR